MIDVASNESAEIVRVFVRASAAAFVQQDPHAVDIRKKLLWRFGFTWHSRRLCFTRISFPIRLRKFRNLLPIFLRCCKAQLFLKSLLQIQNISVFTKDQGNNDPVIARADLPIAAPIPLEFSLTPARDIRRLPFVSGGLLVIFRRLMT